MVSATEETVTPRKKVSKSLVVSEYLQSNPVHFVQNVLGGFPWGKQREILNSILVNPRTTVRSASDTGKSWTAASAALWFHTTFAPSTVLTTAPTWRQVKEILWRELRFRHRNSLVPLGGTLLQTELTQDEKWFAMGISTKEAERFQGFHNEYVLVIADEASGIDESIFDAMENPLSSGNTRFLMIGNPTQTSGTFYKSHTDTRFYNSIQISAFDTPNFTYFGITIEDIRDGSWRDKVTGPLPASFLVSPNWVADKWEDWGEENPLWQCYVAGEFPEEGEDTLIPLWAIEQARQAILPTSSWVEFGVDVARFGADETVVVIRQGQKTVEMRVWGKKDTMETVGRVIHAIQTHGPMVVKTDVIGVGAGVHDRLNELSVDKPWVAIPVNVAEKSWNPELFANRRAEMYWQLRGRFVDGTIEIPDDDRLCGQLGALKYGFTSKGQIIIESKDDLRKRGLKSPDRADALAIAYFTPVPTLKEPVVVHDAMAEYGQISPDLDALDPYNPYVDFGGHR